MPKNISWRKLVQKFRALDFEGLYSGGRHLFMVGPTQSAHFFVASLVCFRVVLGVQLGRKPRSRLELHPIA